MKSICSFVLSVLINSTAASADDSRYLSFTQSTDGTLFAVFISGPCLLGIAPHNADRGLAIG